MIITVADQDKNLCRYARYAETPPYASGWQTFSYGKLGEVTENIRTFALPFERKPYTFTTSFSYDSWNRIQRITYPDGEVVHYGYNRGGMLEKVYGQVKVPISVTRDTMQRLETGRQADGVTRDGSVPWISPDPGPGEQPTVTYTYNYIDSIAYNEFELKRAVFYGNGTHTQYTYDSLQRLETLKSYNSQDFLMQDITYTYDSVSNITGISNAAGAVNGLGGRYTNTYQYDNLYRLVQANGRWRGVRSLNYDLTMRYDKNGRILFKNTDYSTFIGDTTSTISYARRYRYQGSNKVATIFDEDAGDVIDFRWDDAGNLQSVTNVDNADNRVHYWTEDNRMLQVQDKDYLSYYQYDAAGERTYKLTAVELQQRISGPNRIYYTRSSATLYASPYLVITPQGYTKHYYAGAERVASQMGRGKFSDVNTSIADNTATAAKKQAVLAPIRNRQQITSSNVQFFAYLSSLTNRQNATSECYFYHPDHLGSSSWITDSAGTAVQHLHYLPFGETFVSQRSADFDAMYTFSAKEKDAETGYSYFGSRYYSSDLSIWLSVDPMSDKYPSMSPYVYCVNNPLIIVDPNGEEGIVVSGGEYNGDRYKYNFIEPAITRLKELKAAGGDESITWVVMTAGYSKEDIEKFQSVANDLGVGFQAISSAEEFTNYLNSKDIGTNMLSDARKNDKITSLTVFGHGIAGSAEFALGQPEASLFSWGLTDVEKLNKGAFDNADINFYTCNSATDCKNSKSLGYVLAQNTRATVTGYRGQSTYTKMNIGESKWAKWNRRRNGFNTNGSVRMPMAGKNAKRIQYVH